MNKLLLLLSLNLSIFFNCLNAQVSFDYNSLSLKDKIKVKESRIRFESADRYGSGHNQIMAEPEQDCNSAIPVCQNVYNQQQSYSGVGNSDEIPANSSCLGSNEKNSVWYVFTVSAAGNLAFNITPDVNSEDYDFALYEITNGGCQGISNGSTTPIRCNFSATGGVTGLSASGSNASEPASGPNQSTVLPVTVGQSYVLVLSNYSSSQNGYTLDFTPSSASIFDVTPPTVLSTFAACGATTITVKFSEQVLCSSISADGSEFTVTGTGGPYTVTAAAGLNCGNATNEVQLTLNTALSGAGPWTVSVGMGTDGNTLIDNCGNALSPPQTNVFNTSPAAASISGDNSICKGQTMALTASPGTSYSWSGPGTAGQNTNQTISVVQNNAGTYNYTVTVGNGTCGNSNATISVTVNDGPESHFTSPVTICAGQSVTFTNTSTIPCTQFGSGLSICNCGGFGCGTTPLDNFNLIHNWSFGDPLSGVDNFSTDVDAVHIFATPGTYNVNLNVFFIIGGGCSTNETQVVTVLPAGTPITASASPTTICPAGSSTLTASGAASYTWTGPSGFNSTSNPVTVTPASTSTYTVTSPGCGGPNTATVTVTVATATLTPVISGSASVCPNATAVTYSVTNTIGNTYNWSVPAGATITSGQGTNSITVDFGASGGNVDVTETASCGSGSATFAVSVNTVVLTPVISGSASVCPNATSVTYSVTNTIGNTYNWSVPAGATIVSGQGTNSITVDFGAGGGNVDVTETASCGSGSATFAVSVNTVTLTPVISGSASVCPNATAVTYSVTNTIGNTYNWSVPAGATIASGQGTNSITVDFGASGGSIDVAETSGCGSGNGSLAVSTNTVTLTPIVSGAASVCPNATAVTYSVTNTIGNTYNWSVPAGATIASGQGTNSITVDFGASGGNIDVAEASNCGSGNGSLAITINSIPVTSAISGPTPVCPNATAITYSVTNTVGSTYNWTVPAGVTIVSGQNTNSITVDFGATAGTISVAETSTCGTGTPENIVVNTSSTPVTSAITGPVSVCVNASGQIYSVVNTTGSTYLWTVPGGATITSGQNTNSITVDFGATAGTISVTETSACGSGTPVTTIVSTTTGPVLPTITGPSSACANTTGLTYSVTLNGSNTYAWTVPAGATIVSGQGTNSIVVNLGATAGNVGVIESSTCGASPQATTAVTLIAAPVTSAITGTSPVCSGATAITYSVTNTAGSTYNWTVPAGAIIVSGQTTSVITVDFGTNSGNVTVIETASCGSGTPVQFPVTVNLAPATPSIVGNTALCANTLATTYSVTSNAGSTYTWTANGGATISSGALTNSITVDFAVANGVLQVTEANTCGVGIATLTVTVTNPVINLVASASSVCPGYTSTLDASGADTYTWTPAGSLNVSTGASVIATPTATTIYTVNGTLVGCPASAAITVSLLPPLTLTVTSVSSAVCTGTTTSITVTGATSYTWAASSSLNTLSGPTVIASPTVATTYTVVGSTPTCSGTATVAVSVTPAPTIQLTPNDVTICEGETVNIQATGADTYVWANNATNFVSNDLPTNSNVTVNPTSTHLYFVTGSTNGCTDFDTLTVTVLPKIIPDAGLNDTICIGESVGLVGVGGATHEWAPGSTLSSINTSFTTATPLVTTNYLYTASYNGLCPETDTVRVVVNPLPIIFAGQDTTIDVEDAAVINGFTNATSFFWSNTATLNCTGCMAPIATPTVTTTYIFQGTNQYGCENSDTVTVFVSQEFALYVPIAFSPNGDFTNEYWKPEGFGIKKIQIYVYNRWGQKLFEAKDLDSFWDGNYKGDPVQEDVYVFKISAEAYSGDKITKVGHITVVK
ncbi:MAG: gliding motility-associated C-terminal domain-containing protein [Bacteroidota bacterium]|nr:gliding motility-associated C-terminal domain-containing protein [Bacteroidota bacterium]